MKLWRYSRHQPLGITILKGTFPQNLGCHVRLNIRPIETFHFVNGLRMGFILFLATGLKLGFSSRVASSRVALSRIIYLTLALRSQVAILSSLPHFSSSSLLFWICSDCVFSSQSVSSINFAFNSNFMVSFHLPPLLFLYIMVFLPIADQNFRNSIDGDETTWEVHCLRLRWESCVLQRSLPGSPRSGVAVSAHPFLGGLEPTEEDAHRHGDATHRREG